MIVQVKSKKTGKFVGYIAGSSLPSGHILVVKEGEEPMMWGAIDLIVLSVNEEGGCPE